MMKRLLWALPGLLIVSAAAYQKPSTPDPKLITVRMNRGAGPPDGRVSLTVTLTAAEAGAKIGALKLDVSVPKDLLTFTGAEPSGLSEGVSAALKTETTADPKDGTIARTVVSLSTLESSKQPLPDGTLVYLLFHISKEAKMNALIPVDLKGTAVSVGTPPAPVEPITIQGNSVQVSESAVISCFFYMH